MINPASQSPHLNRREALQMAGTATAAGPLAGLSAAHGATPGTATTTAKNGSFWSRGARLAVSLSLMFEGGGQPVSGAGRPIPEAIQGGVPDLPTNAFFAYGHYERLPRLLDLMDRHDIKLSSFMIGKAVEKSTDLAQEIVRRGHEAAAHGLIWESSYQLPRDAEKRFIAEGAGVIEKVAGQKPIGWNAYWMRSSVHILETLQDLGFLYQIDEPAMTNRSSSRYAAAISSPSPTRST